MSPTTQKIDLGSPDSFGKDYMRYLRLREGLSQEQLAHRLGMSHYWFGSVERGTRPMDIRTARKVARYFNEDIERFYGSAKG